MMISDGRNFASYLVWQSSWLTVLHSGGVRFLVREDAFRAFKVYSMKIFHNHGPVRELGACKIPSL